MTNKRQKESILIVDDAPETLELLNRNLTSEGYKVLSATNVIDAINLLKSTEIDLVISDIKMPKISGFDLIRFIRENLKNTEVMAMTGYASVEGAVKAVKAGAEEYLSKPFTDEELFSAVRKAIEKLNIRKSGQREVIKASHKLQGIVGDSDEIIKIFTAIGKAASTTATALIIGESGTGKELVARGIHYSSTRSAAPFVPVNCGGIPETLLESELFGYVKGAFTGAAETRAGFFQTADGGTIFLDEISETSLAMQVKLLRVLQDKEVCMVGANKTRRVDVRIIAATNKDLLSLIKKGSFREDLFFRINVITIYVPPLKERGNDILLLAGHFLTKFAQEYGRPGIKFTDDALHALGKYSWPGNVRELENLVQRLIVMTEGDSIDIPDLPPYMRFSVSSSVGLNRTLADVEAEHMRNVLANLGGNKSKAAEILGIDRKTLREKLKKYKMNDD
jgi:two-component system response regulator HydG